MVREISTDVTTFIEFLRDYNLSDQLNNQKYLEHLKTMHKKAYGYILFIAELDIMFEETLNEDILKSFKEAGSDIMQSIFCWANGAYKPAKLLLRSALETYVKASVGFQSGEIFEEKSIYKIFETAKESNFYKSEIGNRNYHIIHDAYKVLCMTAHNSLSIDLGSINSMKLLPRFDTKISNEFKSLFLKVLEAKLANLLLNFHVEFHKMHPMNRVLFLSTISLSSKREIFEFYGNQQI
jgi:hypothetical protein